MSGWSKDVRNIWSAPISALGVLCYATQCMYGAIRTRFETSLGYDAQVDQSMDTNLVALQPRWPKNTYMGATPDNAVAASECLRAMAGGRNSSESRVPEDEETLRSREFRGPHQSDAECRRRRKPSIHRRLWMRRCCLAPDHSPSARVLSTRAMD